MDCAASKSPRHLCRPPFAAVVRRRRSKPPTSPPLPDSGAVPTFPFLLPYLAAFFFLVLKIVIMRLVHSDFWAMKCAYLMDFSVWCCWVVFVNTRKRLIFSCLTLCLWFEAQKKSVVVCLKVENFLFGWTWKFPSRRWCNGCSVIPTGIGIFFFLWLCYCDSVICIWLFEYEMCTFDGFVCVMLLSGV